MTRQPVTSAGAPAAIGPYSQAIVVPGAVYCSGQIGLDPASGELVDGVEAQAERALRNLGAVLDAAGVTFSDVVKTTSNFLESEFGVASKVITGPGT